ncbi:MAG TPA: DNA internalization-related competence protein ComEC/Rec2 [Thermodesulfobacteriota bacterium]|nr:DNA internalization-related competence protein ComEC/Rec2 [Thermodesulfobacteriota bacterium]
MIFSLSPVFGALSLFKPRLAFLIFMPIGILFSASTDLSENHILHHTDRKVDVEGILFRSPESRKTGSRLFVDVKSVFTGGKEEQASGKIVITTEERVMGLASGDRIRVLETELRPFKNFRNPGNFDIKRYYERQGIYATGFVPGKDWIISFGKDESSNSFVHAVDRLRVRFGNFVGSRSSFPEGEILNALTIGDRGGIPPKLRNQLSEAGIAHVLSISGLHVGAVAIVFYILIKWVLKRSEFLLLRFQVPRLAAALTIIPVFVYTAIAGFATPAVRAFIMVAVYLISVIIGREENKLNTLAVSAFIILLWHPWALFELSFQLSFASVFGILLMHRLYPFKLATFEDKFLSSVKTTVAASFATLPFIINSFGVLSVVSIPANLVFVPLVEFLLVPLGLISFLLFFISERIAAPFIYVDAYLVKSLILGTQQFLKIPFSSLTVPSFGGVAWILYGLVFGVFFLSKVTYRLRLLIPIFILCFLAASAYGILSKPDRGFLKLDFLDAGSRNVIFIRLPQRKTILIDGGFSYYDRGGYIEAGVITPFLLKSGTTKIDYLILTSLDRDHLEGVKALLQKFQVERLWTNGDKLEGELWEIIRDKDIGWKNILNDVETFEIEGVKVEFFKPRGKFALEDSSRPYPLAGKLSFGEVGFLFGEGITQEGVQEELIEIYRNRIRSSVLYMPVISGRFVRDFIETVSPHIIVINTVSQGLPKVPDTFKYNGSGEFKPSFFRTSSQGAVTILTDGKRVKVRTFVDGKKEFVY